MPTVEITYLGNLSTQLTHTKSASQIITDAPVDNNGNGANFSPTDLVAGAYISCMLTIIGIHCNQNGLKFVQGSGKVEKIMSSHPRKISDLQIHIDLSGNHWTDKERIRIERAARNCPVALSIHESIQPSIHFTF
jgi:putative redox protein